MSYKENEVVAKFTKGNAVSDCGEYNLNDLLDMFDETNVTKNELGDYYDFTVNDCIDNDFNNYKVNRSLVVTTECDDMFCYLNKDNNEVDELTVKDEYKRIKNLIKIERYKDYIMKHCDCGNDLLDKDEGKSQSLQ